MRFENVGLASVGYVLPPEIVTSEDLEAKLAPVYERLRLPEGRLRLMSGIATRRLWPVGTRISDPSVESCRRALSAASIDAADVQCLIHASVCREFLEPATACRVHHLVGLPKQSWAYDVSNACLGILNGLVQIAMLIERGAIRSGLVVGTEDSRGLTEATLAALLGDENLNRQTIKPAFASLTIGSGSCAFLLVDRRWNKNSAPIHSVVAQAHTEHHGLCQSDQDKAGSGMLPTMNTDSEQLLHAGIATGVATFQDLLHESGWSRSDFQHTVCHQVGTAHRKLMLSSLELSEERDYFTFEHLGNTGSVALPTAYGLGLQSGHVNSMNRTALLGIGSGVNCIMVALEGGPVAVQGDSLNP